MCFLSFIIWMNFPSFSYHRDITEEHCSNILNWGPQHSGVVIFFEQMQFIILRILHFALLFDSFIYVFSIALCLHSVPWNGLTLRHFRHLEVWKHQPESFKTLWSCQFKDSQSSASTFRRLFYIFTFSTFPQSVLSSSLKSRFMTPQAFIPNHDLSPLSHKLL